MKPVQMFVALVLAAMFAGFALMFFTPKSVANKTVVAESSNPMIRPGLPPGQDLFVYFISPTCPVNNDAIKHYEAIYKAQNKPEGFIGVFVGNEREFENWQKEHNTSFPVVLDPDMNLVDRYGAEASPTVVRIDPQAKIKQTWPGFSTKDLNELNQGLATLNQIEPPKVEFPGAPAETQHG